MKRIAQYVAGRADWSFDVVVHVGAGMGAELVTYQNMDLRRIVLIEANPELAARLRQRSGSMPEVEVRTLALAAHDGDGVLQIFNNARESSLYPATRLLEHFPNLCPAASAPVPTLCLERILREAAPNPSIGNLLVFDVAGLDLASLEGCAQDALHDFSHIAVLTTNLPLYAGTVDAAGLSRWLEQAGYRQLYENKDTVAPFRELLFVRDDSAVDRLRLASAAAELTALRAACATRAAELEACRIAAAGERDEHARQRTQLAADAEIQARHWRDAQAELGRRADSEKERMQRLHTLAASLLARTGVTPAPDQAAAPDIEAFLGHCIDTVVGAFADAGRRARQDLEADRHAGAARERILQAELDSAAQNAARADQLALAMARATAQIGQIRELLLRETEF